jgi:UDP-glucose 4-epimerase
MSEILLMPTKNEDLLSVIENSYKKNKRLSIYGQDYSTPDGTCYRDYIHMSDLLDALEKTKLVVNDSSDKFTVLNLGSGCAISLGEIVRIGSKVLGSEFTFEYAERRSGDVAYSLANITSARQKLDWSPQVNPTKLFESFFEKLRN